MWRRLLNLFSADQINVGARASPLSQVQVQEVLSALKLYYPFIEFKVHLIHSFGDLDRTTSLRNLERSDFFTREIDEAVLNGRCRIGIHSAKDLPDPLDPELELLCVTRGLDPSDALVLQPGNTLETLPLQPLIATSSTRREEAVSQLRAGCVFCDLRGTIGERLAKLESKEVDGVVVAEAALIRLGLTHLNRIKLPGTTAAGQGQLAIVARKGDIEMKNVFSFLDARSINRLTGEKALYFGTNPSRYATKRTLFHCPLIAIHPRPPEDLEIKKGLRQFDSYTHLLFTSQNSVKLLHSYLPHYGWQISDWRKKKTLAIGNTTAEALKACSIHADFLPDQASSEGILELFDQIDLRNAFLFWPHSALSRPLIERHLTQKNIRFCASIFYATLPIQHGCLPALEHFQELIFSSPSTIDAFLQLYGPLPKEKILTSIGPITELHLKTHIPRNVS